MIGNDDEALRGVVLEDGVRVTCTLRLLGERLLLVGTDRGTVVVCVHVRQHDNTCQMVPICQHALHHGPVYHIALSVCDLICTTGHDARCCVLSLASLLTGSRQRNLEERSERQEVDATALTIGSGDDCWWIDAHSLPVVHACFLSDGYTVTSVDMSGVLVRSRLTESGVLAQDKIDCGFPARTLALSLDETCCFVGGAGLARVDWHHAYRPLDAFNTATTAPPSDAVAAGGRHPSLTPMVRLDARGAETPMPPPGLLVSRLSVSPLDGAVTAAFCRRGAVNGAPVMATAQWRLDNPKWYVARTYAEAPALPATSRPVSHCAHTRLRLQHTKSASHASVDRCRQRWPSVLTSRLVLTPSLWFSSASREETEPEPRAHDNTWFSSPLLSQPYANARAASPSVSAHTQISHTLATTPAEKLARAEERNKQLKEKCSELAQRLKTLMDQRKRTKKAKPQS